MAFLRGELWRTLKTWYTGGDPEQGFWRWFVDGLNRKLSFLGVHAFCVTCYPHSCQNNEFLCTAAPPPPPSRLRFVWGVGAAIYFLLREVYLFQVVCGSCSESTAPLAYLNYTEARVCDKCYDLLLKGGLPFFGVRSFIFDENRNLLCLSLNKHYKYTIEANPRRILSSLTLQSYGRN